MIFDRARPAIPLWLVRTLVVVLLLLLCGLPAVEWCCVSPSQEGGLDVYRRRIWGVGRGAGILLLDDVVVGRRWLRSGGDISSLLMVARARLV